MFTGFCKLRRWILCLWKYLIMKFELLRDQIYCSSSIKAGTYFFHLSYLNTFNSPDLLLLYRHCHVFMLEYHMEIKFELLKIIERMGLKKNWFERLGWKKGISCFFEKRVTYLDPLIESLKQINYNLEGAKKTRDTTRNERDKYKIKRRQKSHSSLMDLQTYMSIFAEIHTKVASDALALTSKVVVDEKGFV